jgi:hypothetical protein
MTDYMARGTLGDTYIFCCKLKTFTQLPTTMWHNTKHRYWENEIQEIYSLLPNINVKFIDYVPTCRELTSDVHKDNMIWFPTWEWPYNYHYKDELGDYMVIQPEAGKPEGYNHKELTLKTIRREIDQTDMPVVVLGTSSKFKYVGGDYNLMGMTSVMDAMQITAHAKKFIGPEGLLAFVALSHKVKSSIYYTSGQAIEQRIKNSPWEKYAENLMYIKSF